MGMVLVAVTVGSKDVVVVVVVSILFAMLSVVVVLDVVVNVSDEPGGESIGEAHVYESSAVLAMDQSSYQDTDHMSWSRPSQASLLE